MNDSTRYAQFDGQHWHNISHAQFKTGGSMKHKAIAFWIVNVNNSSCCNLAPGVERDYSHAEYNCIEGAWFEDDRVDATWPEDAADHAKREMEIALADQNHSPRMYDGFAVLLKDAPRQKADL